MSSVPSGSNSFLPSTFAPKRRKDHSLEPIKLEKESLGVEPQPVVNPVHEYATRTFKNPEHAKNFVNWFGESKVVNEHGHPITVYHGTGLDFDEFKPSIKGMLGPGIYASANKDDYGLYSPYASRENAQVKPLYMNIKNPHYAIAGDLKTFDAPEDADGTILIDGKTKKILWAVAKSPNSVKSALGNQGTFDPSNPNIKLSKISLQKAKEKLLRLAKFNKEVSEGVVPDYSQGQVVGKGKMGEVHKIGDSVYKNSIGPDNMPTQEARAYKDLSHIDGIAKGEQTPDGLKIKLPYFKNIVSTDTIEPSKRKLCGNLIYKDKNRINQAITAMSKAGYAYGDVLQFGLDSGYKFHLLDFSHAHKTDPHEALQENLSHLSNFYKMFGVDKESEPFDKTVHMFQGVHWINKGQDPFGAVAEDMGGDNAKRLHAALDGESPHYAYYTTNGRSVGIPDIAQTEDGTRTKVILTKRPLTDKEMADWEIHPVIHDNPNPTKLNLQKAKEKLLRLAKFVPVNGQLTAPKLSEDYSKPFANAFLQAVSGQNAAHKKISDTIGQKLGIPIESNMGVADSDEGSSHAIISHFNKPVDEKTLDYAASWMGLQANQKSTLRFFPMQNGADSLYYLESPETDLKKLRNLLAQHGMTHKVIVPSPKKTGIYIYDQNRQMRDNLNQLANTLGTNAVETIGVGKFLGHEGDPNATGARPKAREDYRDTINANESDNAQSNQDATSSSVQTGSDRGSSSPKEPAKQFQRDIRNRYKFDRARRILEGLIRHHNSPNKELPPVQDLISADLSNIKPEHIDKYKEIIPDTNWDEINGAIGSLQNDPSLYADLTSEHNRKGMYQREHARQVLNTPGLHKLLDMLVSGNAIPEHIQSLVPEAKDGDYYALQAISKELGDSIPSLMAYCKAAEKQYNKAGNMWDKSRAKFSKHALRVGSREEIHQGMTFGAGQFRPKTSGEKALGQVQMSKGNNMHECIKRFLNRGN